MRYEDWAKFYSEILSFFSFSRKEDEYAAKLLNSLVEPLDTTSLKIAINGKRVNIYGAGPSLEKIKKFPAGTNIAADGATSYLLEMGVVPDIIVSDLDGRIEDLIKARNEGSILVIHAHGGNLEIIRTHAARLGSVIGTTQSRPIGNLFNFGGFTDGDRAVFMAHHFGAREIHLFGMDFHGEIGRYSFTRDPLFKKKKLIWAEKLINYLTNKGTKIYFG